MAHKNFVSMQTVCDLFIKFCEKKGLAYRRSEEYLCVKINEKAFLKLYYNPKKVIHIGQNLLHVYGAKIDISSKFREKYLLARDVEIIYKNLIEKLNEKENGNKDEI